jgi:hypothetical protein
MDLAGTVTFVEARETGQCSNAGLSNTSLVSQTNRILTGMEGTCWRCGYVGMFGTKISTDRMAVYNKNGKGVSYSGDIRKVLKGQESVELTNEEFDVSTQRIIKRKPARHPLSRSASAWTWRPTEHAHPSWTLRCLIHSPQR